MTPSDVFTEENYDAIEALGKLAERKGRKGQDVADLCRRALRGDDKAWRDALQVVKAHKEGFDVWQ